MQIGVGRLSVGQLNRCNSKRPKIRKIKTKKKEKEKEKKKGNNQMLALKSLIINCNLKLAVYFSQLKKKLQRNTIQNGVLTNVIRFFTVSVS